MFIDNKYYRWYQQIVNRAKSRTIDDNSYYEKHHIIPKSIGGDNKKDNLVFLTAREHFVCHWLLTKFVSKGIDKMNYALWSMMNVENHHQQRYQITSRIYENLRTKLSIVFSKQHKGKPKSEEHKQKISDSRKRLIAEGKLKVNENKDKYRKLSEKMTGRSHSEETKKKISNSNKGKVISEEQKQYLSKLNTGKKWSEEKKSKLRETMKKQYASGERKPSKGPRSKLTEVL